MTGDPPPRMAVPAKAARYDRHRVGLMFCDDCIRLVRLDGRAVTRQIGSAAWKRIKSGELTQFLCETHKSERQENER